jgi:thiol-disulfide isomerase/thioredoxin
MPPAMKAQIGQKAPPLAVSAWLQGPAVNFDQLSGRVVLVEVFQLNCPGCFLHALPQAIDLYQRYSEHGLSVVGVSTAFEDFDINNEQNLARLIENGEVVGETLRLLDHHGKLIDKRLPYRIPFPLAMDRLNKREIELTDNDVSVFIEKLFPDFAQQAKAQQQKIQAQVCRYLQALQYHAETFERFDLKGTPSQILVDKQGRLSDCIFGACPDLETRVLALLQE